MFRREGMEGIQKLFKRYENPGGQPGCSVRLSNHLAIAYLQKLQNAHTHTTYL